MPFLCACTVSRKLSITDPISIIIDKSRFAFRQQTDFSFAVLVTTFLHMHIHIHSVTPIHSSLTAFLTKPGTGNCLAGVTVASPRLWWRKWRIPLNCSCLVFINRWKGWCIGTYENISRNLWKYVVVKRTDTGEEMKRIRLMSWTGSCRLEAYVYIFDPDPNIGKKVYWNVRYIVIHQSDFPQVCCCLVSIYIYTLVHTVYSGSCTVRQLKHIVYCFIYREAPRQTERSLTGRHILNSGFVLFNRFGFHFVLLMGQKVSIRGTVGCVLVIVVHLEAIRIGFRIYIWCYKVKCLDNRFYPILSYFGSCYS